MRTWTAVITMLGIPLLFTAGVQAAAVEEGYAIPPQVIPPQSTDKFLGNVRNYGNGRPSPNIVYPTGQVGAAANAPGRTITEGPSVLSTGKPAAQPRVGSTSIVRKRKPGQTVCYTREGNRHEPRKTSHHAGACYVFLVAMI